MTEHAWSMTYLLRLGIIPSHPNKILHTTWWSVASFIFLVLSSPVSALMVSMYVDHVGVAKAVLLKQSLHCDKHNGQLILIFLHKFLVNKGTIFPVGNKTWQDKTNQLEHMIHSILPNYCWSCCYSTLTSSLTDMQCNCMMGLFPEIRRAWLTIDSDIFVWNYEDG